MYDIKTTRGSAVWGFNLFRGDALTQLLNDLQEREKTGLADAECERVQFAIGKLVNAATAIPDGSWTRGAIWRELQDFADIYQQWNLHGNKSEDAIELRRRDLRKLRNKRNRIARKVRRNMHVLARDLDLALIDLLYDTLRDLATALPDIFINLAKAIGRYQIRKKKQ